MTIPPNETIRDQILSYAEARLGQNIPRIKRGFVFVMASAVAGVLSLAYRFIAWCLDQTQPATCNEFWLAIHADRYAVPRGAAVATVLQLDVTGTNGSVLDAGTLWATSLNLVYQQLSDGVISGGVALVQVRCLTAGIVGAQADGATLSLVSPLAGIDQDATVDSTVTEGIDRESVDSWRAQVLLRTSNPPQGAAIPDYVLRVLEVPGIVKVLVDPGAGDVNTYPLIATTGTGRVPDAGKLAEVQAYLRDPLWKPLGSTPYALASVERTCAVTITGATIGGVGLTTGQKAQIQAAVDAYLYAAYPKQYPDSPNTTDQVSTAAIWAALVAYGATATNVTISISGIGGGPYVLQIGEIVKPSGSITWA